MVLLGQCVDNVYVGILWLHDDSTELPSLLLFLEVFLNAVYNMPMKWGKHGTTPNWCEGCPVTQPEFALPLKGVCYQHTAAPCPIPDLSVWSRWVDRCSPNARQALKAMVSCDAQKDVLLAKAALHRQINVTSLKRGTRGTSTVGGSQSYSLSSKP